MGDECYEWAIFDRDGELHRGPWSEEVARLWLQECHELGIRARAFSLRRRAVGAWTAVDEPHVSGESTDG